MNEVPSTGIWIVFDVLLRHVRKKSSQTLLESKMGTDEKDLELAAQQPVKDHESPGKEKELPVESPQEQTSDPADPLNTYKWHTGSRGTLDEVKEEGQGEASSSTSTTSKFQKASTNKWSKMQNWRKALSEDNGDKNSSSGRTGEGGKADKSSAGSKRNPFRRALSEPPGSLFAALSASSSPPSSATAATPSAAAEASGMSSTDPSQRGGGGALFKKYLRTVSQKFKRPRLQSRSSTPNMMSGNATNSL